ncbi:MAG TPA: transposase, partial [Lacunisphaera sp.]|nr:transposase [Lacunisphaera sp.]
KDYRFCGYAEAVAGNESARAGLGMVSGGSAWKETQAEYRLLLFGTGAEERENRRIIAEADFRRVVRAGGRLPLATALRCRWNHFCDGAVLGGRAFVAAQLALYCRRTGRREGDSPHSLPAIADWGELASLRRPRHRPPT